MDNLQQLLWINYQLQFHLPLKQTLMLMQFNYNLISAGREHFDHFTIMIARRNWCWLFTQTKYVKAHIFMHLFSSSLNQTFQKCLPNFSLYGSFMDATYLFYWMCVKALSWPTWSYDIFSVCCLDLFIVRTNFFFNSIMTVRFWKSKNPALGIDLWDKVPCWGFLFLHQHFFLPSGLPLIQSNLVDPWLDFVLWIQCSTRLTISIFLSLSLSPWCNTNPEPALLFYS